MEASTGNFAGVGRRGTGRSMKNAAIGCHEIHVYRFGSRVFARSENRRPVGVVDSWL